MTKYNLLETRSIMLDNEEQITIKYYLINETRYEGTNECIDGACALKGEREYNIYGIKLVKALKDADSIVEEDEIGGITDSEDVALGLLKTLADNTITPAVLGEVVDDWATEHLFA